MSYRAVLFFGLSACLPLSCFVQASAQGIPAGGGTSTITRPDSIADTGYWGYMANAPGGVIAGGMLAGKVIVQGNPLVWEPITVVLSCKNGQTDLTTHTDPDGKFVITHVNLPKVYTLDGTVRTQMEQHYEGCTVRASLAGYQSTVDTITERNLRDNPYLDNIVLTEDEHAPGTAISTTTGSASPEAIKAFQKAHEQWLHRNPAAAERELQKAVKADPNFAQAWYLLGRLQIGTNLADGKSSLQRAVAADPRFVLPCVWLAQVAVVQRNWTEASQWSAKALELDPAGTPQIWYLKAQADYHMGKNESARTSAERALAMDPEHEIPNAEELLALTLAAKGDYHSALAHLRNCLTYLPPGRGTDLVKRQIAFLEQQSGEAKK